MSRLTPAKRQLFLQGVPQVAIARKIGVSPTYINRVLNGRDRPSSRVKKAISEITGLPEELLFEEK